MTLGPAISLWPSIGKIFLLFFAFMVVCELVKALGRQIGVNIPKSK